MLLLGKRCFIATVLGLWKLNFCGGEPLMTMELSNTLCCESGSCITLQLKYSKNTTREYSWKLVLLKYGALPYLKKYCKRLTFKSRKLHRITKKANTDSSPIFLHEAIFKLDSISSSSIRHHPKNMDDQGQA